MNADRLVEKYILQRFRNDHMEHGACPGLHVVEHDTEDGSYGCETGCEYVRFSAAVACAAPCEAPAPVHFAYGEFGNLADIIETLTAEAEGKQ